MNKLGNYIKAMKLAKMLIRESELSLKAGNQGKALVHLQGAFSDFITAMNCVTSMAFERKKRVRS
jgi:hypothetical protein